MPQNLLNPFQRVFAVSLGIHSEVDCDGDDEFGSNIFQSPGKPNGKLSSIIQRSFILPNQLLRNLKIRRPRIKNLFGLGFNGTKNGIFSTAHK
jgi:hypothetical protein